MTRKIISVDSFFYSNTTSHLVCTHKKIILDNFSTPHFAYPRVIHFFLVTSLDRPIFASSFISASSPFSLFAIIFPISAPLLTSYSQCHLPFSFRFPGTICPLRFNSTLPILNRVIMVRCMQIVAQTVGYLRAQMLFAALTIEFQVLRGSLSEL